MEGSHLGDLLVSFALEETPDGHVIRVELLPEVLPVLRDVDKHDGAHRGFNRLVSLGDNRRCPGTACERGLLDGKYGEY